MNVAETILEYLRVLIWPTVTVAIIAIFRAELLSVVLRLAGGELDAAGVKLRFALNDLKVVRQEVDLSEAVSSRVADLSVEGSVDLDADVDEILERASFPANRNYVTQVTSAFVMLASSVTAACERVGLNTPDHPAGTYPAAIQELRQRNIITAGMVDATERLGRIYASQTFAAGEPEVAAKPFVDLYVSAANDLARLIVRNVLAWQPDQQPGRAIPNS